MDSGFAARSQVYAGCASLPASAPRNDGPFFSLRMTDEENRF
jgi:hypothetical protein